MNIEVLKQILGGGAVSYHPVFAKAFGSASCAVMLSQGLFWQENATYKKIVEINGEEWFQKTTKEWHDATGITEEAQKTARAKMLKAGVWKELLAGSPAKMHYQIDLESLVAVIYRYLSTGEKTQKDGRSSSGKLPRQVDGKYRRQVPVNYRDIHIVESLESLREPDSVESFAVEVFEPVKTTAVTVEQPRVKVLMPKYDLKKHPLPELEAQRKKLLEQYNDPNTPTHNRAAIEATGKKVAALIQTEKYIDEAILLLNEKAGFTYRLNTPATRKAIKNRLEEYPLENLILVIEHKCKEWADDEKMRQYLRPETLFNGHFESYYQAALIAKKPSKRAPSEIDGVVFAR